MASPQTKTNAIMERIQSLPAETGPNDFLVRSIQIDIQKVRQVDPAGSYMLDGMLNTALKRRDYAIAAHENSVRLAPSRDDVLWNYYASLGMLACYREAQAIAQRMVASGYISDTHIESALWSSLLVLDDAAFYACLKEYGYLVQGQDTQRGVDHMIQVADAIQRTKEREPGLSSDMERVWEHVQSTLREHDQTMVNFAAREIDFYGQSTLHLEYPIEASINRIMILNDALLKKISSDESIHHWDSVIATFVHAEIDNEEKARNAGNARTSS